MVGYLCDGDGCPGLRTRERDKCGSGWGFGAEMSGREFGEGGKESRTEIERPPLLLQSTVLFRHPDRRSCR